MIKFRKISIGIIDILFLAFVIIAFTFSDKYPFYSFIILLFICAAMCVIVLKRENSK
jgi:hypothetical protein